ncbi:unnamed protein product, partial [Meganyctiphanes norvegica]
MSYIFSLIKYFISYFTLKNNIDSVETVSACFLKKAANELFRTSFFFTFSDIIPMDAPLTTRAPLFSLSQPSKKTQECKIWHARTPIRKTQPHIMNFDHRDFFLLIHVEMANLESEKTSLKVELNNDSTLALLCYQLKSGPEQYDITCSLILLEKGINIHWDAAARVVSSRSQTQTNLASIASSNTYDISSNRNESIFKEMVAVNSLVQMGANPNLQTYPASPVTPSSPTSFSEEDVNPFGEENTTKEAENIYRETPIHRAVRNKNEDDIRAILDHKEYCESNSAESLVNPDLNLRDSMDLTVLFQTGGKMAVASLLLEGGADIDSTNSEGFSLLHLAIKSQDDNAATFIVSKEADVNLRTRSGESPLQLCIEQSVGSVVPLLCQSGADMSGGATYTTDPPLWQALTSKQEDIASTLVQHNVDRDSWADGPDGCHQTLLHRAIDENREDIACFLVRSGCDVNATRRPGPSGSGGEEAQDLQTPLHMCSSWGLQDTLQTLLEHGAKVNAKDCEGRTALHCAIENGHSPIIKLLLSHPSLDLAVRNKAGVTPFAAAMSQKNNKAAQAILDREPKAAEQYDHKGHNFLHVAIQKKDMESVLFLLSIHVDMHSRTQDENSLTPLHLATLSGYEMIVRNLLLADGAAIREVTPQKQTVLHLAALHDQPPLASIFLENGVAYDAPDNDLNNALHVAVKEGHLSIVRVLLTESQINAGAVNMRGQNPIHVLANYPKDNAAAIAEVFLEAMPDYDLNAIDVEGNTALLLAYKRGASQLCKILVRSGVCLGTTNKQGVNIFNLQVPTKSLLYRLLDGLSAEPVWSDGELCMECGAKFGLATRKHHCRHCGRLLCSKCSDKDIPILKFTLNKPVRVCQICFEVNTLGPAGIP